MKSKDLEDLTIIVIATFSSLGIIFAYKAFDHVVFLGIKPILLDKNGLYNVIYAMLCFAISIVAIILNIARSERFLNWLNREKFEKAIERGKALLNEERYIEAALTFESALTYKRTPSAHLGKAFALEKMGNLDLAIEDYRSAAFLSYKYSKETLASMTDEYVRALMRLGGDENNEIALKKCNDALYHLKEFSHESVDDLKISRGYVLAKLMRVSEAKEQFEQLAHSAFREETKKLAKDMFLVTDIIELAKDGPERFFEMLEIDRKLRAKD